MKMKTVLYVLFLCVLVLVGVFTFVSSRPKEINPRTIKVGYNAESYNQGPLVVAVEKDMFSKYGAKVELVPMNGGKEIKQALSTGQLDIGLGGASNFIPLMAKDAPMRIIAPINLSPAYIFVRPDTIKSLKDLEGKTIGTAPGGASEIFFKKALKEEGVDINKIKYDISDSSLFAIALMEKKSVDAVLEDEQEYTNYIKAGAQVLPEWETKGYAGPRVPRTVIVANTDFLSSNQELVASFLDGVLDGHRYISKNKSEAARIMADHTNKATKGATDFKAEDIERAWGSEKNLFVIWRDPKEYVEVADSLKEIGDIDKSLGVTDIFDLRFQDKLEKAQDNIYKK